MKVLFCGDRHWSNQRLVHEAIDILPPDAILIAGDAKGADAIALAYAHARGLLTCRYVADWDKYGKAAGPIRNKQMLAEKPDIVIAFHNDIENSKGTKNCVAQARKLGIEVEIIAEENSKPRRVN